MRTRSLHERFLRHIWSRQFLQRSSLKTTDGAPVNVVSPGVLNTGSGPDFHEALLQIGGVTYRGAVEIHRSLVDWIRHRHDRDPRYNNVILHVVLEQSTEVTHTTVASGREIPVLILESHLAESIHTIWEKTILSERLRARQSIPCAQQSKSVNPDILRRWIRAMTLQRLELKLRRFDERLKELAQIRILSVREGWDGQSKWHIQGDPDALPPPHADLSPQQLSKREFWDQLLYEGLMEGLGYSRNREPFLRLARSMTLRTLDTLGALDDELAIQALLFGAAGLLPSRRSIKEGSSRDYVRSLTNIWKERRRRYSSTVLQKADWNLFPSRPTNFPTLRLSAASELIRKIRFEDLFRQLLQTIKTASAGDILQSVRRLLSVTPHPFWTMHYTFGEPTSRRVHPLGIERRDEIIANTIVPLGLLYARTFKDRAAREGTLALFESMPATSTNSITRLMIHQLVRSALPANSISVHQGLIQPYRFYCCEDLCAECDVGVAVFGGTSNRGDGDCPGVTSSVASSSPRERERC